MLEAGTEALTDTRLSSTCPVLGQLRVRGAEVATSCSSPTYAQNVTNFKGEKIQIVGITSKIRIPFLWMLPPLSKHINVLGPWVLAEPETRIDSAGEDQQKIILLRSALLSICTVVRSVKAMCMYLNVRYRVLSNKSTTAPYPEPY